MSCTAKEVVLHTSDRKCHMVCKRRHYLTSALHRHLRRKSAPSEHYVNPNMWLGSMGHFALEDRHGPQIWNTASDAARAWAAAHYEEERPQEAGELVTLCSQILDYYVQWEERRENLLTTVYIDGRPMVEQKFSLRLEELEYYVDPETRERVTLKLDAYSNGYWCDSLGRTCEKEPDKVVPVYHGTIDRLVEDEHGRWWIMDYKFVKNFTDRRILDLDIQMEAYVWAAEQWFEHPIAGAIYAQIRKALPKEIKILKDGSLSVDKRQPTTHALYEEALIKHYGDVSKAPKKNIDFLNALAIQETVWSNKFINFEFLPKNEHQKIGTYKAIIEQGHDMLDPNTNFYPSPSRDCSWYCNDFYSVCLAMNEGADWEGLLREEFIPRHETKENELPAFIRRIKTPSGKLYIEEVDLNDSWNPINPEQGCFDYLLE